MRRVFRVLVIAALVVLLPAFASTQETKPPKKKNSTEGTPVEVRFADSSVVRMTLMQPHLEVTTKFGKLQIPIEDIRGIEFGIRNPDAVEKRLNQLIDQLGSSSTREVNEAREDLLAMKAMAYPAVKRASASSNAKVSANAYELVKKLEDLVPATARLRDDDLIKAADFPVAGRIVDSSFKAKTQYFGDVTIQMSDLRSLRSLVSGGDIELTLEAEKYAAMGGNEWLETELEVDRGTPLVIQASGTVDLYPTGGNYKVNPDGTPSQGRSPDGHPAGALLGRIGSNGKVFVVGSNYKASPTESGRLYLRIASSPWNNGSTGNFQVKIFPNGIDK